MNPYERLASVLDKVPNGFPATPGGEHLRLLEWIFTPEEADLASRLKLRGETADEIAVRLDVERSEVISRLEGMAGKGQISAYDSRSGARKYALMPFVVGIYEEQLGRMNTEFATLFEAYYNAGLDHVLNAQPSLFKVIPVNASLDTTLAVHTIQKAEDLVMKAKSLGVRDCICKVQQALLGNECSYPKTVCILLNPRREGAYRGDELTREISRDEALQLLRDAEKAGLIHCTLGVESESSIRYICNCCTCCCGVLRGVATSKRPREVVRSEYLAGVDPDLCVGCASCTDRCQMDALEVVDSLCVVDSSRCIGCGVCAESCPEGAIRLKMASSSGGRPEDLMDWMVQRAMNRGVDPSELL